MDKASIKTSIQNAYNKGKKFIGDHKVGIAAVGGGICGVILGGKVIDMNYQKRKTPIHFDMTITAPTPEMVDKIADECTWECNINGHDILEGKKFD